MTSVPIPTFVPQDAWYSLTLGNLNPNISDSVPVAADLLPYLDSANVEQDGIVGSLDGAVIYLAGTTSQLDGGQAWLMWEAASMAVSDGITVFCPFVDSSKPGRWINTGVPSAIPTPVFKTVVVLQGSTTTLTASIVPTVIALVQGGAASLTQITLPATTFLGQQFQIKDTTGNAGTNNITVIGTIDGSASYVIQSDYGALTVVWNGTEWSAI